MVLTLLLIAIAMVVALGTALYLAYVETEADFPIRHDASSRSASVTRWTLYDPIPSTSRDPNHLPQISSFGARGFVPATEFSRS